MGQAELQLGTQIGSALARGVIEWKQIQKDRQQKKEFEGRLAIFNQRTISAQQAVDPSTGQILNEYDAQMQRNPNADWESIETGEIGDDGNPKTEPVVRTPEGDIPVGQYRLLKTRKRQDETSLMFAEVDALLEFQLSLGDNPRAQQFVAAKFAAIKFKLDQRNKQAEFLLKQNELENARERNQLGRDELAEKRRQFAAAPGREREGKTFETDERIRGDLAIAKGKAQIEAQNPKGPAEGDISGMRKEFSNASQDFVKVRDAYSRIQSIGNDSSPAGDVALIFSFIRILDPGSTVREGEFATAEQTRGVPDTVVQQYNKAIRGERLSPGQRQDFSNQARNLYSAQEGNQKKLEGQFRSLAERRGMNPEDVVLDIGAVEAPAGAPPAGGGITPEQARAELERRRARAR